MGRKSLDEIYEEVDREIEEECFDREDLKLKAKVSLSIILCISITS